MFNSSNGVYEIDENLDGTVDYNLGRFDFNFVQLRSNLVIRWEYIPGSTLFLVWTQNRDDSPSLSTDKAADLASELFSSYPHNVFLIKYTYRFLL